MTTGVDDTGCAIIATLPRLFIGEGTGEIKKIGEGGLDVNPWDGEPDLKEWTDEGTGYKCLILRNPTMGHLCGYVGLPQDHCLHGVGYNDLPADVDVHGGPSAAGRPGMRDFSADPDYWWVGFDCAHASDLIPSYPMDNCEYRDMDYVKKECTRLAAQLARIHQGQ